jgi:predicted  nucleic acid-binding Zn-ribbon protein
VKLLVEVAPGELIDKITILEIKLQNIKDEAKLANVRREYEILMKTFRANIEETEELRALLDDLRVANQKIWDIEDDIRDLERAKDFGDRFVQVARSVYRSNDARAATKRKINELLDSVIIEEKSYAEY